ncbi:MAG: helix-turn-helix transcriptional regulator [Alphaproteobacteria bacterium]|jgi:transcriptional regulator with XRE-family HTH domain|uniref:helix-turn-helix domain-containing protein n=1 Tax=Pacificispira sp. TaxID=2888761 RepID=UPI001B1BF56A|nr:helix-turn-helix transcriptional regulator [Alphaproteobacteria bacterium]MBO6864775.1 helix-turn-helix transcriptional regulator [Alphaproteobacteria bacterium]MEC9267042.1 helix-turn-helix transcriptional regulator [Pseudomonadota bacterium]
MPHPIDAHVGRRVREARAAKGLSQEKLGNLLGISFQQVQKYEKGANRIGSSRLWALANALEVPVSFFFEDMEYDGDVNENFLPRRTIHMAKQIDAIEDEGVRNQVLNLIKACSSAR